MAFVYTNALLQGSSRSLEPSKVAAPAAKLKKEGWYMRNRKYACLFYMDEKENRHFEKQLAVTGLKKSDLIRRLILKTDIQPKPSEEVIQIYRLVSTIANNANQMAKIAKATGYVDPRKIDGLLIMVDKCWQLIKRIC